MEAEQGLNPACATATEGICEQGSPAEGWEMQPLAQGQHHGTCPSRCPGQDSLQEPHESFLSRAVSGTLKVEF